jgi:hypothetical protein
MAALADLDAVSARGGEAAVVKAKLEDTREEVDALREKYRALLDAFLPPRHKVEDMAPMAAATAMYAVHQEEPRIEDAKEGDGEGIEVIDLSNDEEEMTSSMPCTWMSWPVRRAEKSLDAQILCIMDAPKPKPHHLLPELIQVMDLIPLLPFMWDRRRWRWPGSTCRGSGGTSTTLAVVSRTR